MSNIHILNSIRNNFEYNSLNIIKTISEKCAKIVFENPNDNDINHIFKTIITKLQFNNNEQVDNYLQTIRQNVNCQATLKMIDENIQKLHFQLLEYSNLMVPCIDTYIKTQIKVSEEKLSVIYGLMKNWNLFTIYDFISSLSSDETIFMTYESNNTKPVDVIEYKKSNGKIIQVKHSLFMEYIRSLINNCEIFDFEDQEQSEIGLTNYIYNLSIFDRNELLKSIADGSLLELHYFAPMDYTYVDSVLMIVSDGNVVKEIHFCDIRDWNSMWEIEDEMENFVDVPVTISFSKYKKLITRERLTKALQRNKKIPESCCICLENFKIGNQINSTPCGHFYHANCLKTQLCHVGPPKCPMCRHDVREEVEQL